MPTPVRLQGRVSTIIEHASDLRSFLLDLERTAPSFRPGQFLHLAIDPFDPSTHWPESRVFSIASSPANRRQLRITVSRKGAFTSRMFEELQTGSLVAVKLPFGSFCPTLVAGTTTVLLAGGTGITPFVSFVEAVAGQHGDAALHVHYAARRPELLVYRELLEACRRRSRTMSITYYAEESNEATPDIREGRIKVADVLSAITDAEAHFYLSGPSEMIDAHRNDLIHFGVPPTAVFVDQWS